MLGIFKRFLNRNAKPRPRLAGDYTASAGLVRVDRTATIFACMDRIASEFAALNFAIYDKHTRQKVKRHNLLLTLQEPNKEERHYTFFYQSAIDYLNGGCFWLKVYVDGLIWGLHRLNRWEVNVMRRPESNERYFTYNGKEYSGEDIVYIPSRFGYDTKAGGISIFDAADGAFETARQLEKFTQSSFANGVIGERVVIDVSEAREESITREQIDALRNDFVRTNCGVENVGKPIVQDSGVKYNVIGKSIDNKTVELSENRKFQEHEIAKIFGVPRQLLSASSDEGSLEDAFILFNEFALRPLAAQFQDAINGLLDEARYYFEFDYNGVLKVSLEKRIDAYIKQINNGLLSPNEARRKENMDAIEAGDNYFMPVNLMPLNDETVAAYMAKQKNEAEAGKKGFGQSSEEAVNPTDEEAQHFAGGDDKQ